jgi:hypothetical protein
MDNKEILEEKLVDLAKQMHSVIAEYNALLPEGEKWEMPADKEEYNKVIPFTQRLLVSIWPDSIDVNLCCNAPEFNLLISHYEYTRKEAN